jgi:hypothetical protein
LAEDIGFKVSWVLTSVERRIAPNLGIGTSGRVATKSSFLRRKINSMNITSAPDCVTLQQVHGLLLLSAPIEALDAHD